MEEAAKLFVDNANGQPGTFDAYPPTLKAMFVDNARTLRLDAPPPAPITCAQLGQLKVPVMITNGQLSKTGPQDTCGSRTALHPALAAHHDSWGEARCAVAEYVRFQ
jgi:hypothetical protein